MNKEIKQPCPYCKAGSKCPGVPLCRCKHCEGDKKAVAILGRSSFEDKSPLKVSLVDWISSPQGHGNVDKFGFGFQNIKFIAKPEPDDEINEHPSENERLCNSIAQAFGLKVPFFGVSKIDGKNAFIQEWFVKPGQNLIHLYRFMDANRPYSIENVKQAIIQNSVQPNEDSLRLANIIIFDCLVGNYDRHGRNLALIEEDGKYRLSHVYDNVSGILPDFKYNTRFSFQYKMVCKGKDSPRAEDCILEIKRLWTAEWRDLFNRTLEKQIELISLVSSSSLRDEQVDCLIKHINQIMEYIKNEQSS